MNYNDKKKFPSSLPDNKFVLRGIEGDVSLKEVKKGDIPDIEVVKVDRKKGQVIGGYITQADENLYSVEHWGTVFANIDCNELNERAVEAISERYDVEDAREKCSELSVEDRAEVVSTYYEHEPYTEEFETLDEVLNVITGGECVFVNGKEKYCPKKE